MLRTRGRPGAAVLVEALERLGVDVVFGLPGTQTVGLFEALRRSGLRTVVATHELGAGFMANGYARASGKVGVLCTIPGPGFTYALTALAEARHDSAALLHIVPSRPRDSEQAFPLQAVDQAAMAGPVVKEVVRIEHVAEIPPRIAEAYRAAAAAEPGPVLVEIAPTVLAAETRAGADLAVPALPSTPPPSNEAARLARQIAERLTQARRPMVLAGQGAAGGAAALQRLAEALSCPVATTLSGRGVLPEDHPLALPVDMGGPALDVLNQALDSADLVLVLGCKLTHNGTGGFRLRLDPARCVRVDASPDVLAATLRADLSLVGDVPSVLDAMVRSHLETLTPCTGWSVPEIADLRRRAIASGAAESPEPRIRGLGASTAAAFFEAIRPSVPRETILVTDSGLHQTLVRRYWRVLAPRGLITPSDFQSMGFGIPAALGAALGAAGRPVLVITGDGGFAMAGLEFLTAVRERIPVTVVVFNDGHYGIIRLHQLAEFGHAHGVQLVTPDYATLAQAFGLAYFSLGMDPGRTIAQVLASRRPALIEVTLRDSAEVAALRLGALAKGVGRQMLPHPILRWLRRMVR